MRAWLLAAVVLAGCSAPAPQAEPLADPTPGPDEPEKLRLYVGHNITHGRILHPDVPAVREVSQPVCTISTQLSCSHPAISWPDHAEILPGVIDVHLVVATQTPGPITLEVDILNEGRIVASGTSEFVSPGFFLPLGRLAATTIDIEIPLDEAISRNGTVGLRLNFDGTNSRAILEGPEGSYIEFSRAHIATLMDNTAVADP